MKLGDFFAQAPYAKPVEPREVTFTAMASGSILPGNVPNPSRRQVAAQCKGVLVFVGGTEIQRARYDALESLRQRFVDDKKQPLPIEEGAHQLEIFYQLIWLSLHELSADPEQPVGERMFPDVNVLRDMVVPRQINRLMEQYNTYVEEEHPGQVSDATFRSAQDRGARLVSQAPGR